MPQSTSRAPSLPAQGNFAPVARPGSDLSGSVTELANGAEGENTATHTDSGAINLTDRNPRDVHSVTVQPADASYLGDLTASVTDKVGPGDRDGAVTWTYSVPDAALDGLEAGQTVTQTYDVVVTDRAGATLTQQVTITLNGADDGPAAIDDVPGANSPAAAQSLDGTLVLGADPNVADSATIKHVTVSGHGDGAYDWFSFAADAPGRVVVDIDGASFDTQIYLYDAGGNLVDLNDDSGGDAGSSSWLDSYLDLTVDAGSYLIAVGRYGDWDTASVFAGTGAAPTYPGDTYTMHVSGDAII